jgi:tight adherence protein B
MLNLLVLTAIAVAAALWLAVSGLRAAAQWSKSAIGARTEADLANLFVFVPARRLLAVTFGLTMLCMAGALLASLPKPLLPLIALACLVAPRAMVHGLRSRWRRRLARQLPDALALWAGLLRAGQGSAPALAQVASRQAAPLGDEFRVVLGQVRLGSPLDIAFVGLRDRSGLADLRLLSTLLTVNRELGGNLAESLQRLADLLRSRLLMEGRVQSLTAQGRMQGLVVGLLPLLLLAVLYFMEGETMRVLHTTWTGWAALACIAALEFTGFLLIRRIVRIDI